MSATSLLLDGEDLGALLARAEDLGGRVARVVHVRRAGVAGLLGARRYEVTVDVDAVDVVGPEPVPEPAGTEPDQPPAPASAGLAALLAAADDGDHHAPDPAAGAHAAPAARGPRTAPPPALDAAGALASLGVPPALLPAPGTTTTAALLALAARLPEPPALPRAPGTIAVVGRERAALATCAQVLAWLAPAPARLVLVGDVGDGVPGVRLTSVDAAAGLGARAGGAVVVAGVVPGGRPGAVERVLAALRPTQVWAALDAGRPLVPALAEATAVAPVDALAVQGIEDCEAPGALLGGIVPVGWVAGRPATPVAWAGVLEQALDRAAARACPHAATG